MVKILMGLVAAIVIAVGGFFGFEFYMQHRVAGEVEAAFEQIRATGSKASHGKVSFDLLNRTVTVADIAVESAAQPPVSVKIVSFTASGVSQLDAARFAADSIEATGTEVGAGTASQAGWRVTYKAPQITVKDYSGPAGARMVILHEGPSRETRGDCRRRHRRAFLSGRGLGRRASFARPSCGADDGWAVRCLKKCRVRWA